MHDFDIESIERAAVLSKNATSAATKTEAIALLKEALSLHDYNPYCIKLSNYLLDDGQTHEAINLLLVKIEEAKRANFDFMGRIEMTLSELYNHLGTQMNKLKDCRQSVFCQTISTFYLLVAFSIQGRGSELNHLLSHGAESDYFGRFKFWKPFNNSGFDKTKFIEGFGQVLESLKADATILLQRVEFLNQEKVAHEEVLLSDLLFLDAYQRIKQINFDDKARGLFIFPEYEK